MHKPADFLKPHHVTLATGERCSSDDVWEMLTASAAGDLERVTALATRLPGIVRCEYNYTPPLHFAVREGHLPIVRFLLDAGVTPDGYRTYAFNDTLLTMAEDREYDAIAALLRAQAHGQFPVAEGMAALLDAARGGDLARVRAELARDPALAASSDENGNTALHEAAAGGHLEVMRALIEAGARVDAVRGDGFRPITCALRHGDRLNAGALAGLLLGHGAAYTVYIASMLGDIAFVREALARDPSLANMEDSAHQRPLSAAARRNDLPLVQLLLDHGADPNLPVEGAPRGSALWTSVHRRQIAMAALLLAHGADPNGWLDSGGNCLLRAQGEPQLVELLIAHGARASADLPDPVQQLVNAHAVAELEPLLAAQPELARREGILSSPARDGAAAMVSLLLRYGARVEDESLWARYYYFKHADIAALLLQGGMSPNHMNWQRVTLLHDMVHEGHVGKATLLLDYGAHINAIDDEYRSTPLGYAARWGRQEMTALLLARGADPNLSGAPWATPLAWARKKGHTAVEAALLAAGAR